MFSDKCVICGNNLVRVYFNENYIHYMCELADLEHHMLIFDEKSHELISENILIGGILVKNNFQTRIAKIFFGEEIVAVPKYLGIGDANKIKSYMMMA